MNYFVNAFGATLGVALGIFAAFWVILIAGNLIGRALLKISSTKKE